VSDAASVRGRAPAKVNLSLTILAREAGGFHQLESVFCALDLADDVEVRRGSGAGHTGDDDVELVVEGADGATPELGPVEQNLAVRAARLFARRTGRRAPVQIRLLKRIPAGGGLGGGSSDGAAVLRLLNRLHGEPLDRGELLRLGAELGSDVPFFLAGAALARAGGRGGRLVPLPPLPPAPVLLALPPIAVSTAWAYGALAATRGDGWTCPPAVLPAVLDGWDAAAGLAVNDFEDVVFARHPLLARLRAALQAAGARIARMSGTGSTVFGVFADDEAAGRARHDLAAAFPEVRLVPARTAAAPEE
jgi:4-diphosphocytidyl-2-C-methyl-D-erythritol kinase